jgi:formate dehydrogenase subunit gamma
MKITTDTVSVERHSKLYRILHWAIVAEVLLLIITGLAVSEYLKLPIFSRGLARSLHIVISMAWTATITFFLYYFVVSGEYKWFGLSRIGKAFDFFMHEIKCIVEGKKLESPVRYNTKTKKYEEKVVLTEVLAWWGWLALWIIMVLTGLGLIFPANFSIVNRFSQAIFSGFDNPAAATRFLHVSVSMVMVVYAVIHAYASYIFGMVGSMFTGTKQEPVAETEK